MYITIESMKIVSGSYRGTWILVNDKYYVDYNTQNSMLTYKRLEEADVVKASPKEAASGFTYLNPVEYYKSM